MKKIMLVVFAVLLFSSSVAMSQGLVKYLPTSVRVESENKVAIEIPAELMPTASVSTNGPDLYASASFKTPPVDSPFRYVGPTMVSAAPTGTTPVPLGSFIPEQVMQFKRWWFTASDDVATRFGRQVGTFKVPGDYVVNVRISYTAYNVPFTVVFTYEVTVGPIFTMLSPCQNGNKVEVVFLVRTLFNVPDQSNMVFSLRGWGNGNLTLWLDTDPRSVWPLSASFVLDRTYYDETLGGRTWQMNVGILGQEERSNQFLPQSSQLRECGSGGGKG